jgi:hypothetical protein
MAHRSPLYIGETGDTPIGKLWLAVSDLGLVAVECGKSQTDRGATPQTRLQGSRSPLSLPWTLYPRARLD